MVINDTYLDDRDAGIVSLGGKPGPLAHTESVLFIGYNKCKIIESRIIRYYSVCADYYIGISVFYVFFYAFFILCII